MRSHNIAEAWPLLHTILSSLVLAVLVSSGGTASAGGPARTSLGEGLPAGTVIDLGIAPASST